MWIKLNCTSAGATLLRTMCGVRLLVHKFERKNYHHISNIFINIIAWPHGLDGSLACIFNQWTATLHIQCSTMYVTLIQFWFDKNPKNCAASQVARNIVENWIRWLYFIIMIIKGNDWQIVNQKPISVMLLWNCRVKLRCTVYIIHIVHMVKWAIETHWIV